MPVRPDFGGVGQSERERHPGGDPHQGLQRLAAHLQSDYVHRPRDGGTGRSSPFQTLAGSIHPATSTTPLCYQYFHSFISCIYIANKQNKKQKNKKQKRAL